MNTFPKEKIYISCSKCKTKKFANPNALAARLKKYGSMAKIESEWICRVCKKGDKELAKELKIKLKEEARLKKNTTV